MLRLPGRRRCGLPGLSVVVWLLVLLLQGCSGVGRSALVGRRLLRRTLRLLLGWVPRSVDQAPAVVVKALVGAGGYLVARRVVVPVVVVLLVSGSPTGVRPAWVLLVVVRWRVRVAWPRLPVNLLAVPVLVLVVAPVVSVVLCHRLRVEMPLVSAVPGQAVVTVVLPAVRRPGVPVMLVVGVSPVRSVAQPVVALVVSVVLFRVLRVGPKPGCRRLGDHQLPAALPAVLRLLVVVRLAGRELSAVLWLVQVRAEQGLRRVRVVPVPGGLLTGRLVVVACRGRSRLVVLVGGVGKPRGRRRFSTTAPGFLTRRAEFPGRG
ncbi:hypothetical protein [Corynebacterium bovis]|uniref:hypothetical protein n=1 Tax=Corynebacterium bovis TaxID=36808 RepID=UPI003138BBCE